MTVREVKEMFKGDYVDVEVYEDKFQHRVGFHTDFIKDVEDYSDDDEVLEYQLMDEDEYSQSILANTGEQADFSDWYDDKDVEVLILKICKKERN